MNTRIKFLILALSLSVSTAAQGGESKISRDSETHAAHESLLLIAGLQTTLDLKFNPCSNTLECIRTGNKALFEIQYSPDKHQLIFTPIRRGETTVVLRDTKGDIQLVIDALVSDVNLNRLAAEATETLKGTSEAKIRISGYDLIVDGEVNDLESLRSVRRLATSASFKSVLVDHVHASASLMQKAAAAIQKQLGSGTVVEPFGPSLVLSGHGSEGLTAKAEALALALGLRALEGTQLIIGKNAAKAKKH